MDNKKAQQIEQEITSIVANYNTRGDIRGLKDVVTTDIGQLFYRNISWFAENRLNISTIAKAIIDITHILASKKRKWIKAYKIGVIVISTILAIRSRSVGILGDVKINQFFMASEFFDKYTLEMFFRKGIDPRTKVNPVLLQALTWLRITLGRPVIVNNYAFGGRLWQRGYRSPKSKVGAKGSMHRKKGEYYGSAVDFNVLGMSTASVTNFILSKENILFGMGIRRMESTKHTPTWNHLDTKDMGKDRIYVFNP